MQKPHTHRVVVDAACILREERVIAMDESAHTRAGWRRGVQHTHESVYCISPCAFIREHDVNTFRKSQHTFLFQHCVRPPHMATVTVPHVGKP